MRKNGYYWIRRHVQSEEVIAYYNNDYWSSHWWPEEKLKDDDILNIYEYEIKFTKKHKYLKRIEDIPERVTVTAPVVQIHNSFEKKVMKAVKKKWHHDMFNLHWK